MSRPLGITVLVWLSIAGGVFTVSTAVMGIAALLMFSQSAGPGNVFEAPAGGTAPGILSAWLFALGVFEVSFGMAALELKPWAWRSAVIWCYVSALSSLAGMFVLHASLFLGLLVGVGFSGAILHFLYTDEVKSALGKEDARTPRLLAMIEGSFKGLLSS
jgi:hypothetical protein